MPVVKKLKFDLDGDGIETIIKVSIDSKGVFSADVPLKVKSCVGKTATGLGSMFEAINLVNEMVRTYQDTKRTEKWVILIDFKRDRQPFLNKGVCMRLNYLIANKKQFGEQVNYVLIDKGMDGEYREVGNYISTTDFANRGVVAGQSLEIDYTEEKIKAIAELHAKLETLCSKLSDICNNETQLMQLLSSSLNLLGSGN